MLPKSLKRAFRISFKTFNLPSFINRIKNNLRPPVGNKLIYSNDLQIMVVGGPNQRQDFHIEEGEELFIQLKGHMDLDVIEKGQPRRITIRPGELYLLPARIPHSPQRYADSIGLVFERRRRPSELDGLVWYTPGKPGSVLYEEYFHCTDLGTQLKPIIERYFKSEAFLTKSPTPSSRHSNSIPPIAADSARDCGLPITLQPLVASKNVLYYESDFIVEYITGPAQYRVDCSGGKQNAFQELFLWCSGPVNKSSSSRFKMNGHEADASDAVFIFSSAHNNNDKDIEADDFEFKESSDNVFELAVNEGSSLIVVKYNILSDSIDELP